MKNNKGFTLMELLVAVFIGSMVTVALVSIWKAASLQTSSGQRQSIIRNNLSIFIRNMHRDITEADVIVYPTTTKNTETSLMLVGFRSAHIEGSLSAPDTALVVPNAANSSAPASKYFSYCYDATKNKVMRKEVAYSSSMTMSALISSLSGCSDGTNVMDNVKAMPTIETEDNVNYNLAIEILKDFNDKTPPIHINFEKSFIISGGV